MTDRRPRGVLDTLGDSLTWRLPSAAWILLDGQMRQIDRALRHSDPAALQDAHARLELLRPGATPSIGGHGTSRCPPALAEKIETLIRVVRADIS
ncbi:CATRA system-associated protein [Dactylosporangium sp. NPDC051541]|uniref:CATRA system-associated protein n=1 Tax=Dactylosporangium sp. NPDC051541 TaxID=3363977 RepID=UPI0037A73A06